MNQEVSELLEKALSLPPEARAGWPARCSKASTITLTPTPKRNGGWPTLRGFRRVGTPVAECSAVTSVHRPGVIERSHASTALSLLRRRIHAFHHNKLLPATSVSGQYAQP